MDAHDVLRLNLLSHLDSRRINEIAAFLAVEAEGSFVTAGRALQRHPTVVSKRVASLEKRLGVRLLERTTRQVRSTEAGARLAERLRSAGSLIAEAEQEASQGAIEIRGTLRLALPAAMGRLWLGPMLPELLASHPHLSVVADYGERYVDLVAEGFDAAIRVGTLDDSRLVAKRLSNHRRIICASPDYIARRGMPKTPHDLASHNCLGFTRLRSFPEWKLSRGEETVTIEVTGSLTANDSETLVAAARAGVGILGAGDWLVSRDMQNGRLVRVLPEWELDTKGGVYLLCPSTGFRAAKTKAFVEWITRKFSPNPPWYSERS